MTNITDDYMRQMIASTNSYSVVILKAGSDYGRPGMEKIA